MFGDVQFLPFAADGKEALKLRVRRAGDRHFRSAGTAFFGRDGLNDAGDQFQSLATVPFGEGGGEFPGEGVGAAAADLETIFQRDDPVFTGV